MRSYITNPLSSNQVTEVPILKSDCADFCGNDLNSWLKWSMDQHCKYNWKNFDTSCLDVTIPACEKDLDTILKAIVESICTLNLTAGQTGDCGCDQEQTDIELERGWENFAAQNTAIALRDGNIVHLKGRIFGGSTVTPIAYLPVGYRPSYERRVPFAHNFAPPGDSHPYLKIGADGAIEIVWAGPTPPTSLPGNVWFDGVSFMLN